MTYPLFGLVALRITTLGVCIKKIISVGNLNLNLNLNPNHKPNPNPGEKQGSALGDLLKKRGAIDIRGGKEEPYIYIYISLFASLKP